MPRNAGTGVYARVVNSFSQPVFGTLIDPTDADAYFDDLDVGLNPPVLTGPLTVTAPLTLGVAGTTVGKAAFLNATSGSITLQPPTGALGSAVLTLPDATDTLVARDTTDTLTNKTLTSPTLTTPSLGVATATTLNKVTITAPATNATLTLIDGTVLTGPATTDTLVGRASTDTFTGVKTFGVAGNVGKLSVAGNTSGNTILNATAIASGTLTLPAATDTLVGKATTDILTNKTFNSAGTGNVLQVSGVTVSAGQFPGVTSNTPATAGNIGELVLITASGATATVTMTIATPAVVTWTGYKVAIDPANATTNYTGSPVTFTTTGALPTGVVSGTAYYIIPIDANTFNIATSVTNAFAGTKVATSGSQSGVQTATNQINLGTTVGKDLFGISLTAGEWDVSGLISYLYTATTTLSYFVSGISAVSGTTGGPGTYVQYGFFGTAPGAGGGLRQEFVMPMQRFSLTSTTTIFAIATSSFGVSTMVATGQIRATRIH